MNSTDTIDSMNLERLAMPALLAHWARAVDQMEQAAEQTEGSHLITKEARARLVHEYPIDLSVRHEMARRIRVKPITTEMRGTLAELDEIFVRATREAGCCVLGELIATEKNWNAKREWYYWRELAESTC